MMYRQISKCTDQTPKNHYGGGGAIAPTPGYANAYYTVLLSESISESFFFFLPDGCCTQAMLRIECCYDVIIFELLH